ncbi:UNVERIFIED_CONTAM: hypothetical protein Sradi_3533900 [Sesamum radiatum]|uniref:DEP domain-containing protein n=1 Tax=Sesamum radiatum TaxID=300843 RepID=A0AAW2QF39_SESRA
MIRSGSLEGGDPSIPHKENKDVAQSTNANDPAVPGLKEATHDIQMGEQKKEKRNPSEERKLDTTPAKELEEEKVDVLREEQSESLTVMKSLDIREESEEIKSKRSDDMEGMSDDADSGVHKKNLEEVSHEEEEEPVFDGTEVPGMEANRSLSSQPLNNDSEGQGSAWPEKAVALKNFVRQKSLVAVSTVLRRLSGKSDDGKDVPDEAQEVSENSAERSGWNPLSLVRISHDGGGENKSEQEDSVEDLTQPISMRGRIILYTRKLELEKIAGSSTVPKIFFNEVLIGGLDELKILEESGKLGDKIEYVVSETPAYEAPLPPLSGEDDPSSTGTIDELALIARKMKGSITIKDRFYKMRRFTNCFLGSEAVDFLSEDQYLEREEAVEFCRKLASELFFQHVEDSIFEDGNHLYRFLDDDPFISRCQNIPRGISEVKPKPITEISSRLRLLLSAILEAYASEEGKHVNYRSIHGSEEFARYLRIVEELQRVKLFDMSREEKLSFFINLYNMMAIHAILIWGHPSGALERRKLFGDFKYVIGGSTYSLSAIYNGILRGNQRPPYNLIKPFGAKDRRLKNCFLDLSLLGFNGVCSNSWVLNPAPTPYQVALPHTEPLVHFALVSGTRSGPALRCYSPGNIDRELTDAACNFLRTGGLHADLTTNIVYVSKILSWYSVDFGKNEVEVLRHAANYLDPADSQAFLELLSNSQFKVIYQPYDWGLNN